VPGELGWPNDAVRQHVTADKDAYVAGRDLTIYQSPQASPARRGHPEVDSWVAAIHASSGDGMPNGSGVVIDDRRVLTCAHVVMKDGTALDEIWVAFPMADPPTATCCRVASVITAGGGTFDEDRDVAILELEAPVPEGVRPARLRCPPPKALVGKKWWALGFPSRLRRGSASEGEVGAALALGWVRIDVTSSYRIEPGFSGAGLWSSEYDAVVGIIAVHDDQQNGQALTIYQADGCLPGQGLRELAEESHATDCGELALTAWGWTLATDPEGRRHWLPRGRGVAIDSEQGHRFRGRAAALGAIRDWLDHDAAARRVLVVTGTPGAGKSAVLGRIVTTADVKAVRELPASDAAVRATTGSVACAVHARGATAMEIATEIARAASSVLPERLDDFAPALRDALTERNGSRFNVIIDALDEAASPAEARSAVWKVILPLAETCADVGAQVVVGSRRSDADGDLLAAFGGSARLIDLDDPEFFAEEDLTAYAHATLQLAGDERAGNPYARDAVAHPVAEKIARLSEGNFLVAGLTARWHGLFDENPADPATLSFSPRVDAVMREYLNRIPPVGDVPADALLTALAFAESPGLPVALWKVALKALGFAGVTEAALTRFARSSAASFLVEFSREGGAAAEFRLFHQALDDALLKARAAIFRRGEDEQALARAFIAAGLESGWERAPSYLLRSLPAHAARVALIDELLADDTYLLHADLPRVLSVADNAASAAGQQRVRLLLLAPPAVTAADPPNRAAMLSVTETLEGLGDHYKRAKAWTPYRAVWASTTPSTEQAVLHDHGEVATACAFTLNGLPLLATGGYYSNVYIWNPATGAQRRVLHTPNWTMGICAFTLNERTLLATGGEDGVRIWDPATGTQRETIDAPGAQAICALTHNGRTLLAIRSWEGVRTWDSTTGTQREIIEGNDWGVSAVCALTLNGRSLLATGDDSTVRIWDPATGTQQHVLHGHEAQVSAICELSINGRQLLATGSSDKTVRIWDPVTGTQQHVLHGHDDDVNAVCTLTLGGRPFLASGGDDETIRIWDPDVGTQQRVLRGHARAVTAVLAFRSSERTLLATGSSDKTVRIWDPGTGSRDVNEDGYPDPIYAMCAFPHKQRTLFAATGDRSIRIWDGATGTQRRVLRGHTGKVNAVCALTLNGRTLLATGSDDGTIRLWNPATGTRRRVIRDESLSSIDAMCTIALNGRTHLATCDTIVQFWDPASRPWDRFKGTKVMRHISGAGRPAAICALTAGGRTLIATGGYDAARTWDPATGAQCAIFEGHKWSVNAVCALTLGGRTLIATGGNDGTVRIWDPLTGTQERVLHGHTARVTAVCVLTPSNRTLLATASHDRTLRIWDLADQAMPLVVPTRDEALSVAHAGRLVLVGTANGSLAIQLDPGQ
jgi:WD40 repeat protein